jgi:hypothetical protein
MVRQLAERLEPISQKIPRRGIMHQLVLRAFRGEAVQQDDQSNLLKLCIDPFIKIPPEIRVNFFEMGKISWRVDSVYHSPFLRRCLSGMNTDGLRLNIESLLTTDFRG